MRERWKINCRWQRWKWVNNRHITTKTIEKDNLQSNKASIFIVKSGISLQNSFSLSSRSFSHFRLFHVTNFQIGHNFTVVSVTTGLVWFGFRFSFGFKFTIALPTSGKKEWETWVWMVFVTEARPAIRRTLDKIREFVRLSVLHQTNEMNERTN